MNRGTFLLSAVVMLLLQRTLVAIDYPPTPLSTSLAAHDIVLVGRVTREMGDSVSIETVTVIKGKPPERFVVPGTWRTRPFEVIRLAPKRLYLLMVQQKKDGTLKLSPETVAEVESDADPLVRAVVTFHALSSEKRSEARARLLVDAWKKESEETTDRIAHELYILPADPTTVPFLTHAMKSSGWAWQVIRRHRYKEVAPEALRILTAREDLSLPAATALGELRVKEAYEPIMAMIKDPTLGNRDGYIRALCDLQDERAIPFLIKTLHTGLPGLDADITARSWVVENELAAIGLGKLRTEKAVEPLTRVLELPGYGTIRAHTQGMGALDVIVRSLGQIGPPARDAAATIKKLAASGDVDAEIATEALRRIMQ